MCKEHAWKWNYSAAKGPLKLLSHTPRNPAHTALDNLAKLSLMGLSLMGR
jgi:hypothetical protein